MVDTRLKSFKSQTKNLILIREFVKDFLSSKKISNEDIEKIILAIDEACTNKIKHSYQFDETKDIIIKLKLINSEFIAEISDFGLPFNPEKVSVPNLDENYINKKSGGYGIFLMRKLMDEVNFEFTPTGENRIILKKKVNFQNA
ncbi:MAG: ATP-binding protein [Ignavibacteria bacterium]